MEALESWLKWPANAALDSDFLARQSALLAEKGIPQVPIAKASSKDKDSKDSKDSKKRKKEIKKDVKVFV